MANLSLRPIHYASVSGGKDSFFMLNLVLNNQDKYPLDMVVHFELEIDWNWSKKVIDLMQERCEAVGIKFVRIKPRKSWEELYNKYGFPNAHARWCNSEYKLDCKKQLNKWIAQQNCRPIAYIGFCADEEKRFKYKVGSDWNLQDCCYPLAEEGIEEWQIQEWSKNQPIFEGYYKYFKRQGCKMCPFLSMKEMAYLLKTDEKAFNYMFDCIRSTEKMLSDKGKSYKFKGAGADEIERRVRVKWASILEMEEHQLNMFD